VVDGVDRLRDAVLLDHEIVLVQTEDLVAATVGDHRVEKDEVDVDFLAVPGRLLLRHRRAGGEQEGEGNALEHGTSFLHGKRIPVIPSSRAARRARDPPGSGMAAPSAWFDRPAETA